MTRGVIAGLHGQLDGQLDAFLRSGLQESDITLRKERETMDLSKFFAKGALIPVICQDERNGEVLMLGYANEEALQKTMETGTAWFFSRSRQKLWNKGETSGNFIFVKKILSDCDDDTLIYWGTPKGPVCHTGNRTCFYTTLWEKEGE